MHFSAIFRALHVVVALAISVPVAAQDKAADLAVKSNLTNPNTTRWLKGTVEYRKISSGQVTGPDAVMVRFVWADADAEYVLTSLTTGR